MSEKNVPELRFQGFSGEWENKLFSEVFDTTIPNNTLSRANLNYEKGEVKNIHYGDILIKLGVITDVKKANIPFVTDLDITKYRGHFLADGDVIFADTAEDDTVGKATEITGIGVEKVVSGLHTIPVRPRNLKPVGYLGYYINSTSYHKQLLMLMQGIKVLSISKRNLANTSVIYPLSNNEQTKIGEFFKNLDDIIAQNQKKYDKLVNMKKACLDKMFPKDEADTPEVRFKGFGEEWKNCNLKESSQSIEYGLNAAATKFDGENKYIRITDIDDELRIFLKNDLSSPCIELSNADNYKLQKGDIVFARTGASVGKSYKYNETDGLVYYAGFLIRARLKPEYNPTFIFQNTLTKKYEKYIQITSQRSGQPGVNAQEYSEFSFFAASFDEQTKIGTFFQNLDNLIALQKTKLEKLKNIKKACLDKMFI